MISIGLTGGIATGKSTVAARWQAIAGGALAVVDSDQLAHQTLAPGTPTYAAVVRHFGAGILQPDGTVNRAKLAEIVFTNDAQRQVLNRLVHPAVRELWTAELERLAAAGTVAAAVVLIPLLYEVGAERQFDCVVVVGCSEQTQVARLVARGLSADQARARIRAQWPLPTKMDRADYVIWNDGTLAVLHQQADAVWNTIKENHHASTSHGTSRLA